ncbi:hypothetical protein B0J14DRAFT_572546 [Halenospora varia]|nr:hypothetical protein B0J14DRAFT_572546 [Halenospora varia]
MRQALLPFLAQLPLPNTSLKILHNSSKSTTPNSKVFFESISFGISCTSFGMTTPTTTMRPDHPTTMHQVSASKLAMSRAEFQFNHHSSTNKPYDKIVVGAVILSSDSTKILLLKRSPNEAYYPNVFELPCGNVDTTDATLGHALSRVVFEKTGLRVKSVVSELPIPFEYENTKLVDGVRVSKSCVQVNFIVEVHELQSEVKISPKEHCYGSWVGEGGLEGLEMMESMRGIVRTAFKITTL